MKQVEMFFDYSCPYCLKGHQALLELLEGRNDIEMVWRPCEAHPRPETHGPHSDILIHGLFFAMDNGADVWEYHRRMYQAAVHDKADIESIDVVVSLVEDMLDADTLREALESGHYVDNLYAANDFAYEENGVWAVPVFRCGERRADAVEGIGVAKEEIARVLGPAQ